MSIQQYPEDFEELDFSIEEEHWNEYELSDNSRIKARTFLKKIVRNPNNPEEMAFDIHPAVYVVYSPITNRGPRNNVPQEQEFNNLRSYEVRTRRNDEQWNRYRILRTGQLIRIRLMVTEIRRVIDRFDATGLPFYLVTSGPSIVISPPDNIPQP
jgi:hypothetical protein